MADALKADGKAITGRLPTKSELARFLKDTERHATNAAEHSGYLGSATKIMAEKYNISKKALSFVRSLNRMERAKGASYWADVQALVDLAGLDDTATLFDKSGQPGDPDDYLDPDREDDSDETPPAPVDEDAKAAAENTARLSDGLKSIPEPEDKPKKPRARSGLSVVH